MRLPITLFVLLTACCLLGGCASFNRLSMAQHRNTTIGQELTDLAKAKDAGLINEAEYTKAKGEILAWAETKVVDPKVAQ